MVRSFVVPLLLMLYLTGCTAAYQRSFLVVPDQSLDISEKKILYTKTHDLLIAKGYWPVPREEAPDIEETLFQIRDAQSRILPSHGIREFIRLRMTDSGEVEIRLHRVSHYPPDDFSDKYVSDFVTFTEQLIREASGKDVNLVVTNDN